MTAQKTVTKIPAKPSIGELLLAFKRTISSCTKSQSKKESFAEDLTFPQVETLMFIGIKGRKSMESIASYFDIAPPSATSIIEKLEKKGHVVRIKDKNDRRMVYIELSPNTKKLMLKMWKQKEKVLEQVVSKLSSSDRSHFERILTILVEN